MIETEENCLMWVSAKTDTGIGLAWVGAWVGMGWGCGVVGRPR